MKTKYIWVFIFALSLVACSSDDDTNMMPETSAPNLTTGDADFSNYVAIGNSLTAGFSDGALFKISQESSVGNLLSQRFNLIVEADFNQPLMSDNTGGLLINGKREETFGDYRLVFNAEEGSPQRLDDFLESQDPPLPVPGITTEATANLNSAFNNMGIPGAKSFHIIAPEYGNPDGLQTDPIQANPYFVRMASSANATVLGDAIAQQPTFFSLWIGNNDVLGYALSGGESDISAENYDPITDLGTFQFAYSQIITALISTGAKGIIANIPDITTIPYFTTVPHKPLDPSNPKFGPQIPTLNGIFGQLNQVFLFLESQGIPNASERQIVFSEKQASPVVIIDETLTNLSNQIAATLTANPAFAAFIGQFGLPPQEAPMVANLLGSLYGQARQATENDLLVLPSSNIIGEVNEANLARLMQAGLPEALAGQFSVEGVTLPLADKWVLLPSEQSEVETATTNFNNTIKTAADANGYAFLDARTLLGELAKENGVTSGDFSLFADLVRGGAFSLDGVHPTSRGYALIVNEMLKAIDAQYNTNFEASGSLLDIGNYPTNYSPALQ